MALLSPGHTRADTRSPPPRLAAMGLQPAGQGVLRFFGLKVYTASLWAAPNATADRLLDGPLGLELHYNLRFKGEDIARRSIEEMDRLERLEGAQRDRFLAELTRLFPSIESGDRLMGVYRPDAPSEFFFNGKPIGQLQDAALARLFFRIWLDPRTSEPALRVALLGDLAKRQP